MDLTLMTFVALRMFPFIFTCGRWTGYLGDLLDATALAAPLWVVTTFWTLSASAERTNEEFGDIFDSIGKVNTWKEMTDNMNQNQNHETVITKASQFIIGIWIGIRIEIRVGGEELLNSKTDKKNDGRLINSWII